MNKTKAITFLLFLSFLCLYFFEFAYADDITVPPITLSDGSGTGNGSDGTLNGNTNEDTTKTNTDTTSDSNTENYKDNNVDVTDETSVSSNEDGVSQMLGDIDYGNIDEAINNSITGDKSVSFKDLVTSAVNGQLDLSVSSILSMILKTIFSELYANSALIKELLIIALLSAVMRILMDSFNNNAVGQLGFYVTYIVIVIIIFTSFTMMVSIAANLITNLADLMASAVPVFISLLVMNGQIVASSVFSPMLLLITNLVTYFVNYFLVPLVTLSATVKVIDYLNDSFSISNFSDLLKNICTWSIRVIAFVFLTTLSLEKISAPILNNLAIKAAKATVGSVPIVGDVMSGSMDMVLYWAGAAQSGALVAIIIVIILIIAVPLIELLAFLLTFKFVAAVVQPICDKRVSDLISDVGSYAGMLLGCCIVVAIMFILTSMIIL